MQFLDVPQFVTQIKVDYSELYGVSCLNDEKFWMRGNKGAIELYNIQGELIGSVETKHCWAEDIAVTKSRDLVYADYDGQSIYQFRGKKIKSLITLREWKPRSVCSTASGDILVIMTKIVDKQTRMVRYSGSTAKQTIQHDDEARPLFSQHGKKRLCENKNLDICVADYHASAVVVVNVAGKLRFKYSGPPSTSFYPMDIATDSQGMILVADSCEDRIHVVDFNGCFLRYIKIEGLSFLFGLCVDSRDNLFVAEIPGKVKKIKYYK